MQYLIRAQTWPSGSDPVFQSKSVIIAPDLPEDIATQRQGPIVLISSYGGERDDEAPGIMRERIGLSLVTFVPAHDLGEAAIIGANRSSATASRGRGLLEVEETIHDAVGKVVASNGVRYQVRERSGEQLRAIGGDMLVVSRTTVVEGYVSQDRTYAAPVRFVATGGAGQVVMTWSRPATRYDLRRLILRRASGATPPASATAGTGVTLGGSPDGVSATGVTNSGLAAGTYSYSLFAAYDEYGSSTDERFSAAATAASVVVT